MSIEAGAPLARLVVLIVTYANPDDAVRCLRSLARSRLEDFAIFVCENGGEAAFSELVGKLLEPGQLFEPLAEDPSEPFDRPAGRIARVVKCRPRGRANLIRLGLACENLGYAGGVNAWLERLLGRGGWEAALILNPDTEADEDCPSELLKMAEKGYDMVGATLVFDHAPDRLINCGLHWSPNTGRITAVGRNLPAGKAPPTDVLASVDAVSGACVLVTRACIEEIGLMAEEYFLYTEDLDWGRRRGRRRIGFAEKGIVRHVGGTTIGSSVDPGRQSPLSVYLTARNNILYARRYAGARWILHLATGFAYATRYVLIGAPSLARLALHGLLDGIKGKTGRPDSSLWAKRDS